ncbi:MAG: YibE/F family protein, partial [Patescibacteria group bacterium]
MKRFILIFVFVLCSTFYVSRVSAQSKQSFYDAIIIDVKKNEVTVKFEEGPLKDKSVQVQTNSENQKNIEYRKGDSVVMTYEKNNKGASNVFIADFKRKNQLLVLLLLFLVVVFGIARFRGLLSLIGMMISFTMITRLIIPNILLGNDPVIVTLLASLFIIPITFFITHGVNKKTTIGIAATFLSLVLTGILATLFVNFAKLTGFAAEEAVYIQNIQGVSLNIKNILLAGIIIGAMGVLDDVTISQTSIVQKLREANKDFSFKELYKHAMDIGHD